MDKRTEREQSESRKGERVRKMEQNCSAPGAFGISIMSKTLARWEGRERALEARRDSHRGWRLFREISPGGATRSTSNISFATTYCGWSRTPLWSADSPRNSSASASRRLSKIVTSSRVVFQRCAPFSAARGGFGIFAVWLRGNLIDENICFRQQLTRTKRAVGRRISSGCNV